MGLEAITTVIVTTTTDGERHAGEKDLRILKMEEVARLIAEAATEAAAEAAELGGQTGRGSAVTDCHAGCPRNVPGSRPSGGLPPHGHSQGCGWGLASCNHCREALVDGNRDRTERSRSLPDCR